MLRQVGRVLTPARRRGFEILDDPGVDPAVRERSIDDVVCSNRWLGGRRAAVLAVQSILGELGPRASMLDVGTGLADIPSRVTDAARHAGVAVTAIGVDRAHGLLVRARPRLAHAVCADAQALPFRDASVDLVMCSQALHHFDDASAVSVARELDRVAKHFVIVSDLRRSWVAALGFWIVSFPLRFHRVTRHDGVTSVLRGFTRAELRCIIERATGATPIVTSRLGYRLTACWRPLGGNTREATTR